MHDFETPISLGLVEIAIYHRQRVANRSVGQNLHPLATTQSSKLSISDGVLGGPRLRTTRILQQCLAKPTTHPTVSGSYANSPLRRSH